MQDLINEKEIEFLTNGEHSIDVITGTTYSGDPLSSGLKPITIFHDNLPIGRSDKSSKTSIGRSEEHTSELQSLV